MQKKKVVFLDRDGTINVDSDYVHRIEDWRFCERVPEALKKLQEVGYKLAVVTNQTGIGEGMYSEEAVKKLHDYMEKQLRQHGVGFDAVVFCAHAVVLGCDCRKPETGMARMVEDQLGEIDYAASWMVGDKPKDIGFGKGVGAKTALIRSRFWQQDELEEQPDMIVDSLHEAASKIVISNQ